ncbi:hypothetical protein BDW72DRAFT_205371 [Aspergillus terricola var. indicus]
MFPKPFLCCFPGCTASYQQRSHLRRHEAQHYRHEAFQCSVCKLQLGRRDTLRRHMKKMHGAKDLASRMTACANCRNRKLRCEGGSPCTECQRRGIDCSLLDQQAGGGQGQEQEQQQKMQQELQQELQQNLQQELQQSPCRSSSHSTVSQNSQTQSEDSGLSEKQQSYLTLYFTLFHPCWPFIHRGSFRQSRENPLLVQSMVAIGLWLSGEQNAREKAIALHDFLGSAIQDQKDLWDASTSAEACSSCSWRIPTYQAILLHIIFAALYKSQRQGASPLQLSVDLKPCLAPTDADLLDRLVTSCKRLGMLSYPNMFARYGTDDLPSYVWVSVEEIKRFNMALYRVCQSFSSSSYDAKGQHRLRLCDLQFPLPSNTPLWNAVGKAEWRSVVTAGEATCAIADADAYCQRMLNDALKEEWVSNFADILQWT